MAILHGTRGKHHRSTIPKVQCQKPSVPAAMPHLGANQKMVSHNVKHMNLAILRYTIWLFNIAMDNHHF